MRWYKCNAKRGDVHNTFSEVVFDIEKVEGFFLDSEDGWYDVILSGNSLFKISRDDAVNVQNLLSE